VRVEALDGRGESRPSAADAVRSDPIVRQVASILGGEVREVREPRGDR
jgi:hypothetical protein